MNTWPMPPGCRRQPPPEHPANPAWHIHGGRLPEHGGSPVSFAMLLNLASVVNAETPAILWGFIRRYSPDASPATMPFLDRLVDHAIAYYRDFVRPAKRYRHPTDASSARHSRIWPRRCAAWTRAPMPRRSRPSCTRSASGTLSPNCAPGSAACIKCCSASRKARASAASSHSTGSAETIALIEAALTGPRPDAA